TTARRMPCSSAPPSPAPATKLSPISSSPCTDRDSPCRRDESAAGQGIRADVPVHPRYALALRVNGRLPMPENLLTPYPRVASRYDEMLDGRGAPRAHWRPFLGQIAALS